MLKVYSFKENFFSTLLSNASQMFPGAEKLLSVFYDDKIPGLKAIERSIISGNNSRIQESNVDLDDDILSLRKQRTRSTWIKNLELTSQNITSSSQLDIHSEYDNHVLLIRFPNAKDGKSDLLFVFFKNEDQIFKFSGNPKRLGTSLKDSVANILIRSLDVIRKQIENDKYIHNLVNRSDNQLEEDIESLKGRVNEMEAEQLIFYKEVLLSYSEKFTEQTGISFYWTDDFLIKLLKLKLPFNKLKSLVNETLTIVVNRNTKNLSSIKIGANDLLLPAEVKETEEKKVISIRYEKTLMLLDRYEESAKRVIKLSLPMTGANLGGNCSPSISAAAISDALRKHNKKIITLFNDYPNRWSLIRQEFRPVKNLVYKSKIARKIA